MTPKKRIVLHIDMNSYFASVEQQANPFLRGKAIGVCAYLSPKGVIIASSIEAKAKGIKTGCSVQEAQKLHPKVILLENDPAKYLSTTKKIFKIFTDYTNKVEPYSIDEAFLDLSGFVINFPEAEKKAQQIQTRIKNEVGVWLDCSIGISSTKFLAKFAGDIAAKKSILVIDDEESLKYILKNRPLTDAWGINLKTKEKLNTLGINNLLDLKNYNENKIRRTLGRQGYYLWANMNGIEIEEINQGTRPVKSLGHSYSLAQKTCDKIYLAKVLYKLCEKTGRRLRALNLEAERIHLGLTFTREGGLFKSFKTPDRLFSTEEIFFHANAFLEKTELIFPVRIMSISVSLLSPATNQLSFFKNNLSSKALSKALDKINDKYGEYTVIRGTMFDSKNIARDRIGFRKTLII